MQKLSPLHPESAKRIESGMALRLDWEPGHPHRIAGPSQGESGPPFVLGFDAWHFQLSDGPILEEMIYA